MSAPPAGRAVPGNRWDLLDGTWPDSPPAISVIVVHYDQPGQLSRTLAALAAQTHPATRTEVIVVDDGSPRAPAVPDGVTLLFQEDRGVRPGAARTLGAARASGEVLCFLDADTTPEPDYLRALSRLPAIAPEAVTVGHRRHADLTGVALHHPIELAGPAAELPEPAWLRDGYAAARNLLDADDRSYRFVISAVLACSRWFFADTGPFAPEFDTYGGEDWEWAYRAWRNGALLAHVPDAVAWHDGPDWHGRHHAGADRRAEKNAETLRLAQLIPVAGSRGRALRPARAEIVVRLTGSGSPAAAFQCVDSLLEALPEAAVVVPDELASVFAADHRVTAASVAADASALRWPRLDVRVARLARVVPERLRSVCDEVTASGRAAIVGGPDDPLLHVVECRAELRARRWGVEATGARILDGAGWVRALEDEPDLEAYLGGWGQTGLRGGWGG